MPTNRFLATLFLVPAWAAAQGPATTAPPDAPAQVALTTRGEPGTPLAIQGVIRSATGRTPIPGASIYVYQTDARGAYHPDDPRASDRPRLRGYLRSDSLGRYRFTTVRPGSYPNTRNPGHVHYHVSAPGFRERVFEIVFEGDSLIPAQWLRDAANDQAAVAVVRLERGNGGLRGIHDVVLRPRE